MSLVWLNQQQNAKVVMQFLLTSVPSTSRQWQPHQATENAPTPKLATRRRPPMRLAKLQRHQRTASEPLMMPPDRPMARLAFGSASRSPACPTLVGTRERKRFCMMPLSKATTTRSERTSLPLLNAPTGASAAMEDGSSPIQTPESRQRSTPDAEASTGNRGQPLLSGAPETSLVPVRAPRLWVTKCPTSESLQ